MPSETVDRKRLLREIADAYFEGLAAGDIGGVPYAEDATLRTPLAPAGEATPIRGKAAILEFFAGIYEAIGSTRVKDYFFNDALTAVCVQAEIDLRGGTGKLNVADVFHVDANGTLTAQQNHYDPRPAIR
jgi:hypothetical protein